MVDKRKIGMNRQMKKDSNIAGMEWTVRKKNKRRNNNVFSNTIHHIMRQARLTVRLTDESVYLFNMLNGW